MWGDGMKSFSGVILMASEGEVKVERVIRGRGSSDGAFCISSSVSARS